MPKIDINLLTDDELKLIIRSRVETDTPYTLEDIDEAGRLYMQRRAAHADPEKALRILAEISGQDPEPGDEID